MTVQEMHSFFRLVADKVGSPYFTSDEIDEFLNVAQGSLLEDYVFNRRSKDKRMQIPLKYSDPESAFENVSYINEYISNLVKPLELQTDSNGRVTYTAIDNELTTTMYSLVNMSRKDPDSGEFKNVRYWRHNDYFRLKDNVLKTFNDENPVHLKYDDYIQVLPNTASIDIEATVIRYPIAIDYDTSQGSELSESSHDEIVYLALELAGISMREIQELNLPMTQRIEKEG